MDNFNEHSFSSLQDILGSFSRKYKLSKKEKNQEAIEVFNTLYASDGKMLATHMIGRNLNVTVESSGLASMMSFQAHKMIQQINLVLKQGKIDRIFFHAGKIPASHKMQFKENQYGKIREYPDHQTIPENTIEYIETITDKLKDEKQKKSFQSLLKSLAKRSIAINKEEQNPKQAPKRWKD